MLVHYAVPGQYANGSHIYNTNLLKWRTTGLLQLERLCTFFKSSIFFSKECHKCRRCGREAAYDTASKVLILRLRIDFSVAYNQYIYIYICVCVNMCLCALAYIATGEDGGSDTLFGFGPDVRFVQNSLSR